MRQAPASTVCAGSAVGAASGGLLDLRAGPVGCRRSAHCCTSVGGAETFSDGAAEAACPPAHDLKPSNPDFVALDRPQPGPGTVEEGRWSDPVEGPVSARWCARCGREDRSGLASPGAFAMGEIEDYAGPPAQRPGRETDVWQHGVGDFAPAECRTSRPSAALQFDMLRHSWPSCQLESWSESSARPSMPWSCHGCPRRNVPGVLSWTGRSRACCR